MIVAGFGFRASATEASLRDALARAAGSRTVDRLAAPADKVEAGIFLALARRLDLPVIAVGAGDLEATPTVTHSDASLAARGTGSVAEAAALVAAGPGARLLAPRAVSSDGCATCALAEGSGK